MGATDKSAIINDKHNDVNRTLFILFHSFNDLSKLYIINMINHWNYILSCYLSALVYHLNQYMSTLYIIYI